jgi:hypothetical protein
VVSGAARCVVTLAFILALRPSGWLAALSERFTYREKGAVQSKTLEFPRVVISARDIERLYVSYVDEIPS